IENARENDLPAITAILNHAAANTTATWHEYPKTDAEMTEWFAARTKDYVVLAARDASGLLGYASYGPFRAQSGYRSSAEHSIYVREDQRGKGIGKALLAALIESARAQGLHVLVGGVDADNELSIALHKVFGFEETGRLPQVGRKFGRWLTLVFLQKSL
ncbi:MAG TPA: GNAT family N-acetyltransferase, partial [Rhizomicrobium sp.]|nr:GNAT family N-acetyltransferase [Rhizomicrobium sp.]